MYFALSILYAENSVEFNRILLDKEELPFDNIQYTAFFSIPTPLWYNGIRDIT